MGFGFHQSSAPGQGLVLELWGIHFASGDSGFLNLAGAAAPVTVQFWSLIWSHLRVIFSLEPVSSALPSPVNLLAI